MKTTEFAAYVVAILTVQHLGVSASQYGSDPGTRGPQIDVQVSLPLKANGWIAAIGKIERFERKPLGLELTPDDLSGLSRDDPGTMLVLTGVPLVDAARLLADHDPRYGAQALGGVLNIRPRISINAPDDFLNRVLPSFHLDHVPLREALQAVHRALDPLYTTPRRRSDRLDVLEQRMPGRGFQVRAALARPITLDLANVTVHDVLNQITLAHGDMWWYVIYRQRLGAYPDCTITFAGFDNWAIAAQARPESTKTVPHEAAPRAR